MGVIGVLPDGRVQPEKLAEVPVPKSLPPAEKLHWERVRGPWGTIIVCCSRKGVRQVRFASTPKRRRREIWPKHDKTEPTERPEGTEGTEKGARLAAQAAAQLAEYFAGQRRRFTLPLDLPGTPFERKVWRALCQIPYGKTRSYREIARRIGNPRAARAVGMANHHNPVAILVPCHRVISTDGTLGGYAGGIKKKARLLALERAATLRRPPR